MERPFFILIGASACVELKKFDEAITWCDKGLAVSFSFVWTFKAINYYIIIDKLPWGTSRNPWSGHECNPQLTSPTVTRPRSSVGKGTCWWLVIRADCREAESMCRIPLEH